MTKNVLAEVVDQPPTHTHFPTLTNSFSFFFSFSFSQPGGVVLNAWNWIPGVWEGGVPRKLEWKGGKKKSYFEYKDALSFILLADWILDRFVVVVGFSLFIVVFLFNIFLVSVRKSNFYTLFNLKLSVNPSQSQILFLLLSVIVLLMEVFLFYFILFYFILLIFIL